MTTADIIIKSNAVSTVHDENPFRGGVEIPGKVTDILSEIANGYEIYFMPGSMLEKVEGNGKATVYNSAPII